MAPPPSTFGEQRTFGTTSVSFEPGFRPACLIDKQRER